MSHFRQFSAVLFSSLFLAKAAQGGVHEARMPWWAVEPLIHDQSVTIALLDGTLRKGRVETTTAAGVVLSMKRGRSEALTRESVRWVQVTRRSARWVPEGIAIGFIAGVTAGMGLGEAGSAAAGLAAFFGAPVAGALLAHRLSAHTLRITILPDPVIQPSVSKSSVDKADSWFIKR